jgi:ABC-type amino acid transport substrate-binding protein
MRSKSLRQAFSVSAVALAGFYASLPHTLAQDTASAPGALRLCADPDNLPFSSDNPAMPGIYNEIGEAIGKAIGRPVTHVWYRTYFGARAVRVTLLAKQCDVMIGLPDSDAFMGPKVIFSKPLFSLGYAIVAAKGESFASVEDLKGKRVAVQFETEPQNVVGPRDDMTPVTVLSVEEGMKALAEGRADAAFLWAPTAGYLNQIAYDSRFSIDEVDGPRLTWKAAIGYPKRSASLRDAVDAALPEVAKTFPALFAKYGFATVGPAAEKTAVIEKAAVAVAQAAATASEPTPAPTAPAHALATTQASTVESGAHDPGKAAGDGTGDFDVAPVAPPATSEMIAEGKEVFNGICAHCHGPDAVMGQKRVDLRRLTLRYGDGAHNMI